MKLNRKAAEEYLYKSLDAIDKSGKNSKIYKDLFAKMTDNDFGKFVNDLKSGEDIIAIYLTNLVDHLTIEDLLKLADKMGIKLFERIRRWDPALEKYYLTPNKYCVLELPVRRMSQFIDHKLSVAEGDNKIDLLSGQVVREDKAASISQVEIQTMYARNLKKTIKELVKQRGGDVVAFGNYKRELEENGSTTLLTDTNSVPRSAVVLDALLSGMQLDSNASGV